MTELSDVQTWLYHLSDVSAAEARRIGQTNADLIITEWADYSGVEAPYTPARLDAMRGDDPDRLVISYLSIGEAETYRYYWDPDWQTNAPDWLGEENPEWEGNIKVRYWDPDWQAIILDYIDRIIDGGFNGVYLDIIDGYEQWEDIAPNAGINYRQEMADFVALIDAHTTARIAAVDPGRDFHIIGQNGLELLRNATYRGAIDGVGVEDLRFYYRNERPGQFAAQGDEDYAYTLALIDRAERAGLQAFVIEYIPPGALAEGEAALAGESSDLGARGVPLYIADDRIVMDIAAQPWAAENGDLPGLGALGPRLRIGTDGGERLAGRAGSDLILANGGDDRVLGRAGADILRGGRGDDVIRGNAGADTLDGGRGDDRLSGGGGADTFQFRPGDGNDVIIGFDLTRDSLALPLSEGPTMRDTDDGALLRFTDGSILLQGLAAVDVVNALFL